MFVLVIITLLGSSEAIGEAVGTFETLEECFDAREDALIELKAYEGHFPRGINGICLQAP